MRVLNETTVCSELTSTSTSNVLSSKTSLMVTHPEETAKGDLASDLDKGMTSFKMDDGSRENEEGSSEAIMEALSLSPLFQALVISSANKEIIGNEQKKSFPSSDIINTSNVAPTNVGEPKLTLEKTIKAKVGSLWGQIAVESVNMEKKLCLELEEVQNELDLLCQAALRLEELRREVTLRRSVHSATEPFDFATAKVAQVKLEARRRMREGLATEIGPENAGYKLILNMGFVPGSGLGFEGRGRLFPVELPLRIKTHRGGVGYFQRDSPRMKEGFDKDAGGERRKSNECGDAARSDADKDYLLNESFMAIAIRNPRFEVRVVNGKVRVATVDVEAERKVGKSKELSPCQLKDAVKTLHEDYDQDRLAVTPDDQGRFVPTVSEDTVGHGVDTNNRACGDNQFCYTMLTSTESEEESVALSGDGASQFAFYVGNTMYFHNPSVSVSSTTSDHSNTEYSANEIVNQATSLKAIPKVLSTNSIKEILRRANESDSDDDEWSLYEINNVAAGDGLDVGKDNIAEKPVDYRDWYNLYSCSELASMARDYLRWKPAEVVNKEFEVFLDGVMTFQGRHLDNCCDLSDIDYYSRMWDSDL